ncbi:VanZ family protein [Pseudarthrobacter sp. NPDC092424]|uniref:VanZ family protein n=1 Tax=Pseudarthrobacter sp. NPDC092424 TaxID=3364415 RepID=UPI0038058519
MLGFAISGCMELGQLIFLHNRFATPVDLLTNTSGAVIGALLAGASARALAKKAQARHLPAAGL